MVGVVWWFGEEAIATSVHPHFTHTFNTHTRACRHRNEVAELEAGVYTITTTPKIGIGQRCFLVPDGSGRFVLWDCVSFVDPVTVEAVEALGYAGG